MAMGGGVIEFEKFKKIFPAAIKYHGRGMKRIAEKAIYCHGDRSAFGDKLTSKWRKVLSVEDMNVLGSGSKGTKLVRNLKYNVKVTGQGPNW